MLRRFLSAGVTAAILAWAANAHATSISFSSFGGAYPLYTLPPNETLYTDFSTGNPGTGGGSLYPTNYGTQCFGVNCVAAPGISGNTQTAGQFFAVLPGQSETFTFAPAWDVSVYLGSLDDQNTLTILLSGGGSEIFTGSQLAAVSGAPDPVCSGTCTIYGALTNGRWTFGDNSADIVGIQVYEGFGDPVTTTNSFEIAQIATSVPELSTWALMGLGFLGLAYAGYRGRRAPAPGAL